MGVGASFLEPPHGRYRVIRGFGSRNSWSLLRGKSWNTWVQGFAFKSAK